jgi:hypothetical protein
MSKFTDVMIDIETLGSNPRAPVIQIGACAFSLRAGEVGPTWSELVRPNFEYTKPDVDTIAWWMKQNEDARLHVAKCVEAGIFETEALQALTQFIADNTIDVCAWAMPPEFDLVILRNLGDARGIKMPWHYAATRDLRTLEHLVGKTKADRMQATTPHDAGSDAAAQASTAIKYYRALSDYYPSHEALSDLVHLMSEEDALNGGGPGFGERWAKAKSRAFELFEP